jgi:hypothetical protein
MPRDPRIRGGPIVVDRSAIERRRRCSTLRRISGPGKFVGRSATPSCFCARQLAASQGLANSWDGVPLRPTLRPIPCGIIEASTINQGGAYHLSLRERAPCWRTGDNATPTRLRRHRHSRDARLHTAASGNFYINAPSTSRQTISSWQRPSRWAQPSSVFGVPISESPRDQLRALSARRKFCRPPQLKRHAKHPAHT